jgi:hypothetical protein
MWVSELRRIGGSLFTALLLTTAATPVRAIDGAEVELFGYSISRSGASANFGSRTHPTSSRMTPDSARAAATTNARSGILYRNDEQVQRGPASGERPRAAASRRGTRSP